MVNYQLGKIYKIVDNTNGNIYIGSTCEQYISRRLAQHRSDYKKYLNGTFNHITSFEILKNEDHDIVLIESYPCDDKMQLHARERHYIETLKCVNIVHPLRTKKEYRNDNKETIKVQKREYRNINKEKIKVHKKEYREANQEKIKVHKQEYYNANKDIISANRNAIKDAINAKKKDVYKLKKEQQTNIIEV